MHDDDGVPNHFDLVVDGADAENDAAAANVNATVRDRASSLVSFELKRRTTSSAFLSAVSGLGEIYPQPILDKPSHPSCPDVCADERRLFDEMVVNYSRKESALSHPKSFQSFADDWKDRCLQEAEKKRSGEPALELRLKTAVHLRQYYDRLQEQLSTAEEMTVDDQRDARDLRRQQEEQRITAAPAATRPVPQMVTAPVDLQMWGAEFPGPRLPSVMGQDSRTAPSWPVRPPSDPLHRTAPQIPPPPPTYSAPVVPPDPINLLATCNACGHPKKGHPRGKVHGTCERADCICGKRRIDHDASNPSGPKCKWQRRTVTPSPPPHGGFFRQSRRERTGADEVPAAGTDYDSEDMAAHGDSHAAFRTAMGLTPGSYRPRPRVIPAAQPSPPPMHVPMGPRGFGAPPMQVPVQAQMGPSGFCPPQMQARMESHSLHMPPTRAPPMGSGRGVEWIDMATDYSYYGRHGGLDDDSSTHYS